MSKNPLWWALPLFVGLVACGAPPAQDGRLQVVATTGMIADAARTIGGDLVAVEALMGPGVDPHLFKASERDVRRLAGADLILYHGLYLEGAMADILGKMSRQRPALAVGETVPEEELLSYAQFGKEYDPHIWFDVALWARVLEPIADALAQQLPEHREELLARAHAYRDELVALDRQVAERIAEIPPQRRVLVTAHDAFGYFGRRYDIEVVGIQGISTVAEAGLEDMERTTDLVVERAIPAVFIESSISPRTVEALQGACRERGHEVKIGGQLYSDAMGPADSPAGTYPGMVRSNVDTIVEALR